jgi:hypothetical protein
LPTSSEKCKLTTPIILKVKLHKNGDVYDEFGNYLGKGVLKNGELKIKQLIK